MEQQFIQYIKKIQQYQEALNVLYWDMRTGAPKKGLEQRARVIGTLSAQAFELQTSPQLEDMLTVLEQDIANLPYVTMRLVEEVRKSYDLNKKIPVAQYEQFTVDKAQSEAAWEQAKEASDFAVFLPHLEKMIAWKKKFIHYWGEKNGSAYNTLLDQYEPNMTTDILDRVFSEVRAVIAPLVKRIVDNAVQPNTDMLFEAFPIEGQRQAALELLTRLGYDFEAGRLDETVHPFMIELNRGDIRVTTKYDEYDFRSALFGVIHECGHALYEQNIDEALTGLPLCTGASMGIHESQSLFYENFIGRNEHFWTYNFPLLQQHSPAQFGEVAVEDFLKAINVAKPSLIRIEADELTYILHIIVRYELERDLFNGTLQAKDLPQRWNELYAQYLGIQPQDDAQGVLQDIHWSDGSFGYFPSYALGYMYAAQWKHAIDKDIPNFDELCATGNLTPIRAWLTDHVHQYGALKKPFELLQDGTGEALNPSYLTTYLQQKYTRLYEL